MQVVVTGAGTVLGQAVLRAIVARGVLTRADGAAAPVRRIIAVDRVQPANLFVENRIEYVRGDYEQPRFLARMMGLTTDSVFHLSALGAGMAADAAIDAQFDGLDNALLRSVDTTRALLDACRFQSAVPKLVFASTREAWPGAGAAPEAARDTCTAMCELLLIECARRKLVDVRCVRLPCLPGNGSSAQAIAIEAVLADVAAGRAPPGTGESLTPVEAALPEQAAAALIEAHELAPLPLGEARIIEMPGRLLPIAGLLRAEPAGAQALARNVAGGADARS